MDLHNVTLSRELQVGFHLTLPKCSHVSSNTKYKITEKSYTFSVSAGHGGGGCRKLPQHLGQEEEN